MTTTGELPPTPPPPPTSAPRVLRRSTSDRVGAGVAGGLGEYFGLDPVLFRVLFATTAFFGGAGIVAYLLAWAAIPDAGTASAPVDRLARELRQRHVPLWLVAGLAVLIAWALLFSWWAPWPFAPVVIAVVLLVIVLSRRSTSAAGTPPSGAAPTQPPYGPLTEEQTAAWTATGESMPDWAQPTGATQPFGTQPFGTQPVSAPPWMPETRAWLTEARERSRTRRHRAAPVRWTVLGLVAVSVASLALADTVHGIVIPVYFWVVGGIVLAGLIVGATLRRTPWSVSLLLVPALLGILAFGNTKASLHDGLGQQVWNPASGPELQGDYRLAFGQGVLDLRDIGALDTARHTEITAAAGQIRILVPRGMNVTVSSHVRFGTVQVDGNIDDERAGTSSAGVDVNRDVRPLTGATGPGLTVDVHLADGQISIQHV